MNSQCSQVYPGIVMSEQPQREIEFVPAQGPVTVPRLDPVTLEFTHPIGGKKIVASGFEVRGSDGIQWNFNLFVQLQRLAKG